MSAFFFSFLLPKFFGFYLLEIQVLIKFLQSHIKGPISLIKFPGDSIRQRIFRSYIKLTLFVFIFKFSVIIVGFALQSGNVEFSALIFEFKMLVYLILLPLVPISRISSKFFYYLLPITLTFFLISTAIYLNTLRTQSFSSLIWRSNEFGGRFVGYTGSSISNNGLELIGSTANSVGILYVFLFYYFTFGIRKSLLGSSVCLIGAAVTMSQTAIMALILVTVLHVILTLKISKVLLFTSLLAVFVFYVFISYLNVDFFFRLVTTVSNLLENRTLSGTGGDRITQWKYFFESSANCPMSLIIGQFIYFPDSCGTTTITESYFLDSLKKFGIAGLLISTYYVYKLIQTLQLSKYLLLMPFWITWIFINIFLANTLQSDIILMTIFLIWKGSLADTTYDRTSYFQKETLPLNAMTTTRGNS